MARKRMFDNEIISQDTFLDLPMEAKALYFLLGMEADDEGFVSPKRVLRLYGGTDDSLKILALKNFIIPFKSGVIVITDWKRNNYIDKNRLKETIYQEEKSQLIFNVITEKYEFNECLTDVKQMLNQSSIEESSIEESSIEENSSSIEKENDNDNDILYDKEVEEIQKIMIESLGTTNLSNIKDCIDYLQKIPIDLIKYALKKTAKIDRPSWKYAETIIKSYIKQGFKTIEEVMADDIKYKNKKQEEHIETKEERIARLKKEYGVEDED